MAVGAAARQLEWAAGALDAYLSTVARIGADDPFTARLSVERVEQALAAIVAQPLSGHRQRGAASARSFSGEGLSLRQLRDARHGVDLRPLEPNLLRRLATRDRCVQLAPERHLADLQRAAQSLRQPLPALVLVGRRHVRSNNYRGCTTARVS